VLVGTNTITSRIAIKVDTRYSILGTSKAISAQTRAPDFDLVAKLNISMYVANVVEGNWTARTSVDATGRTVALLEEVRRRNDVHLIHVKGHSVHEYPGNEIADELAWWGKEGPPFCQL
jgi:hypothetical protein